MNLEWERATKSHWLDPKGNDPEAHDWLIVDGRRYGFVRYEYRGCWSGWRANTADKFPNGYLFDSQEEAEAYLETDVIVPGGCTFCPFCV